MTDRRTKKALPEKSADPCKVNKTRRTRQVEKSYCVEKYVDYTLDDFIFAQCDVVCESLARLGLQPAEPHESLASNYTEGHSFFYAMMNDFVQETGEILYEELSVIVGEKGVDWSEDWKKLVNVMFIMVPCDIPVHVYNRLWRSFYERVMVLTPTRKYGALAGAMGKLDMESLLARRGIHPKRGETTESLRRRVEKLTIEPRDWLQSV